MILGFLATTTNLFLVDWYATIIKIHDNGVGIETRDLLIGRENPEEDQHVIVTIYEDVALQRMDGQFNKSFRDIKMNLNSCLTSKAKIIPVGSPFKCRR